jgi:uncharacterized membrane protein
MAWDSKGYAQSMLKFQRNQKERDKKWQMDKDGKTLRAMEKNHYVMGDIEDAEFTEIVEEKRRLS